MKTGINDILNYLKEKRKLDCNAYRAAMVNRRMEKRLSATKCENYSDYLLYMQKHPNETDKLIDSLTINVSRFFRDSLTFDYLADKIIPTIVHEKMKAPDHSLRIWSAGCAMGEEPYSIAILITEFFEKEALDLQTHIFATDIDENILEKAQKAVYPYNSIESIKYGLLKKYFTSDKDMYRIKQKIRGHVSFSIYNILDERSYAPPESIFGSFDLVFCRNVLIYFNLKFQDQIFKKLHQSLIPNGYLILGEAEIPSENYKHYFKQVNSCCHIYQKK